MDDVSQQQDELATRLREGDEQALAELASTHQERLWRMIDFRLDDRLYGRLDPDDVLQEAYLAAAQRLEHFRNNPRLSPFVWFRMIVLQTLVDLHRVHLGVKMRDAGKEIAMERCAYPQTTCASLASWFAESLTSPSQAAARAEQADKIEEAIESMDPIDREVLALRHFEDLTNSEVAEVLGIQQKAASIRYFRALRRLKSVLAELPGMLDEDENDWRRRNK